MIDLANKHLQSWVEASVSLFEPAEIVQITGSSQQYAEICGLLESEGRFVACDPEVYPNSFWAHSEASDVARVEERTFICSEHKEDAGPTNNWMSPQEAKQQLSHLMQGCMRGRRMYIIPYLMGAASSELARVGVQLTDSAYVVANMFIMARVGEVALQHLGDSESFVKGWHSVGTLDVNAKYVCHFPETREIISFNSDYGGNALQGKKCFALRIASAIGRDQGWLAEHMLIMGITNPQGERIFVAAAFPSACGKTNLAMLVPPASYLEQGWKVETIGDDIAWIHPGADGRFYAINPENGFFGVAPGTSKDTNPNMIEALKQGNSIFTNTAFDLKTKLPWWEGCDYEPGESMIDWQGQPWNRASGQKGAHPNSRFTTPAVQCPSISELWESPEGVPLSAIIFGGRRAAGVPLVVESFDWAHGVYLGSVMSSEKTAAATGGLGNVRIDPMAMLPFCGYHMADYFRHWLSFSARASQHPKIFQVNWFRKNSAGQFIWPGFGENIRVLEWIFKRVKGQLATEQRPYGLVPRVGDLNLEGIEVNQAAWQELFAYDSAFWKEELARQSEFYKLLGERVPEELQECLSRQAQHLSANA
jgi:phosphoenolpyruvate carboxykinase (GTP)